MSELSAERLIFTVAELPATVFDYKHLMSQYGISKPEAKRQVQRFKQQKVYLSDTYQVSVQPQEYPFTVLTIKRRDKAPIDSWREKQLIKNAVMGSEIEAVELFPAESRLVDTANQYWLFAMTGGERFPFGFQEREVSGAKEASDVGASQRPFNDEETT